MAGVLGELRAVGWMHKCVNIKRIAYFYTLDA
jgi:hypothetical protein